MEANIGFADKIKLAFRVSSNKIIQRQSSTKETSVIETSYGPVKGVKRISIYGDSYYSFEKIPFAKPPLGALRFRAPQEPEPWTEIKNCTEIGPKPVQKNIILKIFEGSEDCLYVNVYSKEVKPEKPLPVLVWIYGGAFQVGEASRDLYSPDYFMMEDVVIIAVTYRLGPLGFLSLDDPELGVPGNAGLKDQVLALKWVKKNCDKFGGDPNRITVFGESAGAASTHYMMLTEQTKGLFHKGIVMSGTALAQWALIPSKNWSYRLARALGFTGTMNDRLVLNFLEKAKASDVMKYSEKLRTKEEKESRLPFAFGPSIEPYIQNDCVIPKHPVEMMRNAWSNKIPMMIGGNSFEGLLLYTEIKSEPELLTGLGNCEDIVPLELNLPKDSDERHELGLRLKAIHFGYKEPSMSTKHEYMEMYSYKHWWHPIHRTVTSRLRNAAAPTYLYRFDFDSKFFNQFRTLACGKKFRGTCHADDMSYLFYNVMSKKLKTTTMEYKTIERMVDIWTKFASDSDPNTKKNDSVIWKPLNAGAKPYKCLNISNELKIINLPETEKIKVWDSMYREDQLC